MLQSLPSLAEGTAFSAIIPRMDERPTVFKPVDKPQSLTTMVAPPISGAEALAALNGCDPAHGVATLPEWQTRKDCGLITVVVERWQPNSARAVPPSLTDGLGRWMSAQWVILFNQSTFARKNRRWAVVTSRGTALILCGIKSTDRPINPGELPPCVDRGLTHAFAFNAAVEANTKRIEVARVPRNWTVCVERADSVRPDTEEVTQC